MLRNVRTGNPPLTEKKISEFLQKVPFDLPQPYLDFLRRYNGGRPDPNAFPIDGLPLNPDGAVQVFFGIGTQIPSSDLRNVLMGIPATVPLKLFPIACTDGNDYVA